MSAAHSFDDRFVVEVELDEEPLTVKKVSKTMRSVYDSTVYQTIKLPLSVELYRKYLAGSNDSIELAKVTSRMFKARVVLTFNGNQIFEVLP